MVCHTHFIYEVNNLLIHSISMQIISLAFSTNLAKFWDIFLQYSALTYSFLWSNKTDKTVDVKNTLATKYATIEYTNFNISFSSNTTANQS